VIWQTYSQTIERTIYFKKNNKIWILEINTIETLAQTVQMREKRKMKSNIFQEIWLFFSQRGNTKLDLVLNLNIIDRFEKYAGKYQLISGIILKSFRNKKKSGIHLFLACWETETWSPVAHDYVRESIDRCTSKFADSLKSLPSFSCSIVRIRFDQNYIKIWIIEQLRTSKYRVGKTSLAPSYLTICVNPHYITHIIW
jgi:hypothetical protein